MSEPDIIVSDREQLAELLTEAIEVEHNLMCCYLFAAWSLKSRPEEGLTSEQFEAVTRWRRVILDVAIDEMTHFANANNLLAAIGMRPHISRPNFPVAPGYHPAEVLVALHPFNRSTIDHFVFLERPMDTQLPDGAAFVHSRSYRRATQASALMPSAQDFETVGGLYRGIRQGVVDLSGRLGPEALFLGEPGHQIGPPDVELPGLTRVRGIESALEAIDAIVEQGEGNESDPENSHYRKFCRVRDELAAFLERDPAFEPTRPVAHDPVQREPPIPDGKTWVRAPEAARLLDLANALYNHMLRMVGAAYGSVHPDVRSTLLSEAITLMQTLSPVNDILTRLPAVPGHARPTAGMSFAVTREIRVPSSGTSIAVLAERTLHLAEGMTALVPTAPDLAPLAERIRNMSARLTET